MVVCLAAVHGGNATGPFLVSAQRAAALRQAGLPEVAPADSIGYDGQFFLDLALNPLPDAAAARRAAPAITPYRGRRVLWSGLAWMSGLGHPPWVVWALYFWQAAFVGLGTWALARWARVCDAPPAWGVLFCLQIGVVASVWRMVGDAVFAACIVLTVLWLRTSVRRAGVALTAALLQKEVALLALPVALARTRGDRRAQIGVLAAAGIAASWWLVVALRLAPMVSEPATVNFGLPGAGFLQALAAAMRSAGGWIRAGKDLGFLGLHAWAVAAGLLAGGLALRLWLRERAVLPAAALAMGFALLGSVLSHAVWREPWAYSRVLLPLVLLCFMAACELRHRGASPWLFRGLAAPAVASALLGPVWAGALAWLGRP